MRAILSYKNNFHVTSLLKVLFVLIWMMPAFNVMGQNPDQNAEKYHFYRNRLQQEFMLYSGDGNLQASHLPMESRYQLSDGTRVVYWADGTWWLGHYVAVLATEYACLQRQSRAEDARFVLEELSEALKTYERLDREAESCWNGESLLNGFYLRDDVDKQMAPLFNADQVRSDYALRCGQMESRSNGPSQDQAWASYMGFSLLLKLVDDTLLQHQASEIACRMIKIMYSPDEKGKRHWQVVNPVNQLLVQKENDIKWLRYPHTKAFQIFSDDPQEQSIFSAFDGGTSKRIWKVIQNNYAIDKNGKFNWYGVLVLSAVLNEKGNGGKSTVEWLAKETKSLAKKRPDYGQTIMFPHLPLVNQVLYDTSVREGYSAIDILSRDEYEQILNAAPPEGAYRISSPNGQLDSTAAPWHTLSLFCPWHTESQGYFNMLDYMLLYNLYQLVFVLPPAISVETPDNK